ncbi:MAG: MFS transporter, partial [Chloroflexota bacterium]
MIAVLRRRDFALLWTAGLISLLGDSVLRVALPFYVYQRTGSPASTGLMVIVETLPQILFGSVAGVFVDRWDRKRTLVVADLLRAGLLLLLPLTTSDNWFWLLYAVAFLQATTGQFFFPARSTPLTRLVDEERLLAANSLEFVNAETIRLIGPPLG